MVCFINKTTGTEMWVAEDRVEEYKAAGHKPAASSIEEPAEPEEKPKKAVKRSVKKK
ncbi:MAG: hypothetical protein K5707_04205 [Clostridia bacterium]|nr:hypothetical protein [Clostridia bacterium]